ncbi:YggS family pyridoxal phosphate-dependent enzyme [Ectothiorhodospira lacustris]|uniref:YggS family pyridoxal phosphate-dependent enzyme n=1 Tax=Ectothiorhodospira lacustris TaxID=2899127 RepID=UPI001EE8FAB1|nr:YggS family pyridoxal phosphate-dependent enzyme [Ectothiorhodospira lacustris]MCG5510784.1 YggS family pyridoxal phosphate-dependent enzyme [Ectothiorhodospira lacustris]MCG5522516.1 YggS family pyridoxal phosphate-dependent enzyme [Ectothiorhodospira lacustris]
MNQICERIRAMHGRIQTAAERFGRRPEDIRLLAVSKTHPAATVAAALACGQQAFGENYASELTEKAHALEGRDVTWHFIGPIQGNKTRAVAEIAHWVHAVDRERIARRLSDQRPESLPPLQVCIQVNVSGEASKSGITAAALPALAETVATLPHLQLRGLMAIPAPSEDFDTQRRAFARLRQAREDLIRRGHGLDTLSMGMSDDLEAAIAEGATLVRVGTAIFGSRSG